MRLSELARIVSGEWHGADIEFAAASIDTRTLRPGEVFFAIAGERFDGHDFVAQAAAAGAGAAVVERRLEAGLPQVVVAHGGHHGHEPRRQSHRRRTARSLSFGLKPLGTGTAAEPVPGL